MERFHQIYCCNLPNRHFENGMSQRNSANAMSSFCIHGRGKGAHSFTKSFFFLVLQFYQIWKLMNITYLIIFLYCDNREIILVWFKKKQFSKKPSTQESSMSITKWIKRLFYPKQVLLVLSFSLQNSGQFFRLYSWLELGKTTLEDFMLNAMPLKSPD